MRKSDVVALVAAKTKHPPASTQIIVDEVLDVLADSLAKGEKIDLQGFGDLSVRESNGRKSVIFRPAKALADLVNK